MYTSCVFIDTLPNYRSLRQGPCFFQLLSDTFHSESYLLLKSLDAYLSANSKNTLFKLNFKNISFKKQIVAIKNNLFVVEMLTPKW